MLLLIALDWIAIHNIVQGNKNLTGEYVTVACTVIVFVILAVLFFKQNNQEEPKDKS